MTIFCGREGIKFRNEISFRVNGRTAAADNRVVIHTARFDELYGNVLYSGIITVCVPIVVYIPLERGNSDAILTQWLNGIILIAGMIRHLDQQLILTFNVCFPCIVRECCLDLEFRQLLNYNFCRVFIVLYKDLVFAKKDLFVGNKGFGSARI